MAHIMGGTHLSLSFSGLCWTHAEGFRRCRQHVLLHCTLARPRHRCRPLLTIAQGSIFPVFTVEFGRRPIMLGGAVLCAIFMACLAGTTSVVESSTGSRKDNAGWASAAFIFLYYLAFGGTYNAIPWLWPAEINGLRTRGQGAAFATMVGLVGRSAARGASLTEPRAQNNWLWNFVIVQITPIVSLIAPPSLEAPDVTARLRARRHRASVSLLHIINHKHLTTIHRKHWLPILHHLCRS